VITGVRKAFRSPRRGAARFGGTWLCLAVVATSFVGTAEAQYFHFGKNRVQYKVQDWRSIPSEHFVVYFDADAEVLARETVTVAERAYRRVASLIGHHIDRRIPIIVYGSHRTFGVTNAVQLPDYTEGIGGVTEIFKNRIAIPFTGDRRQFELTLHHEIVHAVLNDLYYGGTLQALLQSNVRLPVPAWFNEGLAEYSARNWSTEADMFIREAVLTDNLPPIEALSGQFAYHGGRSVWDYVAVKYGEEKIGEIVRRYRTTRSVDLAFRLATGLPLSEVSRRWRTALQEVHFPEVAARERLEYIGRVLGSGTAGTYYANPVMSPAGDRVAFLSTRSGLFDLYVQRISTNERLRLIRGQLSSSFESLPILTAGISWSPDGRRVAVAAKSGRDESIITVDILTGERKAFRLKSIDQLVSISWGPTGSHIAVEAVADAQSDIFLMDIETGALTALTGDEYSDHAPSFHPDGASLVFHSDRASQPAVFGGHEPRQHDLFQLDIATGTITRLTDTPNQDEHSAEFAPDGRSVAFLSDRNGITNLYLLDLQDRSTLPLTNLLVGIRQYSLSSDGTRAAILSLNRGTPTIFVVNYPLQRRIDEVILVPNVWAQRRDRRPMVSAPSVLLASDPVRRSNPYLLDASDAAGLVVASADTAAPDDDSTSGDVNIGFPGTPAEAPPRNDFFLNAGSSGTASSEAVAQRYRLRFTPDLVYGTASYDVLYGVQGVTQMTFSDMLGDHRFTLSTNLLIDLRNSDYSLSYENRRRRADWQLSAFQTSRILRQSVEGFQRLRRFRRVGVSGGLALPFDKFNRVDFNLTSVRVSQADITDSRVPALRRSMVYPSVTLTRDVSVPGFIAPSAGVRMAIGFAGSPITFEGGPVRFFTVVADLRRYIPLREDITLAIRGSGGSSFGPERQSFYSSGVQNWVNRSFDELNGFPVSDLTEFLFASPVLPLRGFEINERNGARFALTNVELRFPLKGRNSRSPFLPLRVLRGSAFVDMGAIGGALPDSARFRLFTRDEDGRRRFADLMMGAGFGLRSVFLGYPVRLDVAWPFDGQTFGGRRVYFSVGFDF